MDGKPGQNLGSILSRPSIVGWNFMGKLGPQLMQAHPGGEVMKFRGTQDNFFPSRQETHRTRTWILGNITSVGYSQSLF